MDAGDEEDNSVQGDVNEQKKASTGEEKSDADLDREELDRIRQRFQAKKMAIQEKKKPTKLDMDDDEEEPAPVKTYVENESVTAVVSRFI